MLLPFLFFKYRSFSKGKDAMTVNPCGEIVLAPSFQPLDFEFERAHTWRVNFQRFEWKIDKTANLDEAPCYMCGKRTCGYISSTNTLFDSYWSCLPCFQLIVFLRIVGFRKDA